jgi:hypothetical protein
MAPQKRTLVSKTWWATVRSAESLPVLWQTYRDAIEQRDPDEYVVRVRVTAEPTKKRAR